MVVRTFDPSTWEAGASDLSEFEATLVYVVSSRIARDTLSPKGDGEGSRGKE